MAYSIGRLAPSCRLATFTPPLFLPLFLLLISQAISCVPAEPTTDSTRSSPASSAQSFLYQQAQQLTEQISHAAQRLRSSLYSPSSSPRSETPPLFDYIVVGGGAAGCPAARTLADAGKEVLLIERGSIRSREATPNAMDIYGTGIAIRDREISQLVITKQGVRTHIGTVMGGGTAINMAIIIEETEQFFDFLQANYPGVKWDKDLVRNSYEWVCSRVASPMPIIHPYGDAWMEALAASGFTPNAGYNTSVDPPTPQVDPSLVLQEGMFWQGMSLFNSSNNFYRSAADVLLDKEADGSSRRPDTLTLLTRHTVLKVEFEHEFPPGTFGDPAGAAATPDSSGSAGGAEESTRNASDPVPRAVCVVYRETQAEDVATINSRRFSLMGVPMTDWVGWLEGIFDPLRSLQSMLSRFKAASRQEVKRACVRAGGEIILSAGAVLTPTLLYKSGVGPKEQVVDVLGLPLVKEFPTLGQNVSDRVLIPVGLFREGSVPPQGFPTRICQAIGAKKSGPDCENFNIGDRSLSCSVITQEELSGTHVGENVIYATRYIFPPEHRNEPIVEYMFNVITACSEGRYPYNSVVMASACVLAQPIIDCFKRVVAGFYFTAEPKSRGTIKMTKEGDILVDPQYMSSEQDLFDAVRGVSTLIEAVNTDVYRGLIETGSGKSCPVTILNGLLELMLQVGSTARPLFVDKGQFEIIQKHIEDLLPDSERRSSTSKRSSSDDGPSVSGSSATSSRPQSSGKIPERSRSERDSAESPYDLASVAAGYLKGRMENRAPDDSSDLSPAASEYLAGVEDIEEGINSAKNEQRYSYVGQMFSSLEGQSIGASLNKSSASSGDSTIDADLLNGESWYKELEWNSHRAEEQWVASYPPNLPDPKRPADVARYVLSYMTSIWHFTGSAAMGDVVDSNFRVMGIKGLAIVDASVLNQVTRMNPTATLMMLGRYAALAMTSESV